MTALTPAPSVADQVTESARLRAMASHPCCTDRSSDVVAANAQASEADVDGTGHLARLTDESGSMATEYGLIVVVAAVICSLLIKWASDGGIFSLLQSIIGQVGSFLF